MSSRTQKVGIPVFAMSVLLMALTVLTVGGAAPAAAQEGAGDEPLTVVLVVDEWDGEVMTGRETEAPPAEGDGDDGVVDEWDGEVMTGRASAGTADDGKLVLLVVAGPGRAAQRDGVGEGEEPGEVDEWDGEVMTGRALAGAPGGHCRLQVDGAEQSFRVLRAIVLRGGKVLKVQPQPARRSAGAGSR